MKEPLVWVSNLKRGFAPGVDVLKGVNLEAEPGESLVICGRNGSGKTTLLKVLSTLVLPDSGKVKVCGYSTTKSKKEVRQRIGFLPAQENSFFPRLTGHENLAHFGKLYSVKKNNLNNHIKSWQEIPTLGAALSRPYYLCSSGMKQVLALCRASLHDPDVLFLDEPKKSLDDETFESAIALISNQILGNKNKGAIICSSHNGKELKFLKARHLTLVNGVLNA